MSSHAYNTSEQKQESITSQDDVLIKLEKNIVNHVSIGKLKDVFINSKDIIIKRLKDKNQRQQEKF